MSIVRKTVPFLFLQSGIVDKCQPAQQRNLGQKLLRMKILLYDMNPTGHCPSWAYWSATGLRKAGHKVTAALCTYRVEVQPWVKKMQSEGTTVLSIGSKAKRHLEEAFRLLDKNHLDAVFFPNLDSILFNAGKYPGQPDFEGICLGGILLRPDEIKGLKQRSVFTRLGEFIYRGKTAKAQRKKRRIQRLTSLGWKHLYESVATLPYRYLYLVEKDSEEDKFHIGEGRKGGFLCDPWISRTEASQEEAREKLGLPKDVVLFLHTGTSRKEKGLEFTCQVIHEELAGWNGSKRYYLLRTGSVLPCDVASLERLAEIDKLIWFKHYLTQDELDLCYAASDWVLLPYFGQKESSGVLVNAAAHNRPVLATNYGKIGQSVREHKLGLLFPQGDKQAFAKCIQLAINGEPSHTSTMKEFAENHSPSHFMMGLQNFGRANPQQQRGKEQR